MCPYRGHGSRLDSLLNSMFCSWSDYTYFSCACTSTHTGISAHRLAVINSPTPHRWRMYCGWSIFRYSRHAEAAPAGCLSVCGTDIRQYGQSIFTDESSDRVTVYSTGSVDIELRLGMLASDRISMEIRMVRWEASLTRHILVERLSPYEGKLLRTEDRSIRIQNGQADFTVSFYHREEADTVQQWLGRAGGTGSMPSNREEFLERLRVLQDGAQDSPAEGGCEAEKRPFGNVRDFIARLNGAV